MNLNEKQSSKMNQTIITATRTTAKQAEQLTSKQDNGELYKWREKQEKMLHIPHQGVKEAVNQINKIL